MALTRSGVVLHFDRFEFKYLIPMFLLDEFLNILSRKGEFDSHNLNQKPYLVSSLYFDSPSFTFYWDKINGLPYRSKVRIRHYDETLTKDSQIFLEIKHKDFDRLKKERVPISKKVLDELLNGRPVAEALKLLNTSDVFRRFYILKGSLGLEPKLWVRYKRISVLNTVVDFKVSLDLNLSVKHSGPIADDGKGYLPIFDGFFVLEIKFDKTVPLYMLDFLRKHELDKVSVSKYCYAAKHLYGNSL